MVYCCNRQSLDVCSTLWKKTITWNYQEMTSKSGFSAEIRTIKKCAVHLKRAVLGHPSVLVHFLECSGFLTEDVPDEILNPYSMLREDQKADILVKWIKRRVRRHKESYHVLVEWFKKQGEFYRPIADRLEATYKKYKEEARTERCRSRHAIMAEAFLHYTHLLHMSVMITHMGWITDQLQHIHMNLVIQEVYLNSPLARTVAIRNEFANLLQSLANNLMDDNPDITRFREYITGLFGADINGISNANTINDIFDALSMNCCWSYLDVTYLKRIISDCSGQSRAHENMELLRWYEEKLAQYKAATKIPHFVQCTASIENGTVEVGGSHSILSATVTRQCYNESLLFVDELWGALCSSFREHTDCPQVLHKIYLQFDNTMVIEWFINEKRMVGLRNLIMIYVTSLRFQRAFIYNPATAQQRKTCSHQESGAKGHKQDERVGITILPQRDLRHGDVFRKPGEVEIDNASIDRGFSPLIVATSPSEAASSVPDESEQLSLETSSHFKANFKATSPGVTNLFHTNGTQLDEAHQNDGSSSDDDETSSLYEAEVVCGTSQSILKEHGEVKTTAALKRALSVAEKKIMDCLIRNCFDAYAASWKHTQSLNGDQQEYPGKGLSSLDIYRNFTDIYC